MTKKELLTSGRDPETSQLNLESAGVQVHPKTKKILGNNKEQTTASHIYAIGDVLVVRMENNFNIALPYSAVANLQAKFRNRCLTKLLLSLRKGFHSNG